MNSLVQKLRPVIRYGGGKTGMLWRLREVYPEKMIRYFEPYVGGGAVLFDLAPQHAIIGDMNTELIQCYTALQADTEEVLKVYKALWNLYGGREPGYYEIRGYDRLPTWPHAWTNAQRAARFLFLCHTCFNGRYQVNNSGKSNTSWGRILAPRASADEKIRAAGEYFRTANVSISLRDGVETLNIASAGDFAFIDPPYIPISKTAKFTDYTAGGFTFPQQMALLDAMDRATDRGVKWVYTNADRPMLWEYFERRGYICERVPMRRNMGGAAETRIEIGELMAMNYKPEARA